MVVEVIVQLYLELSDHVWSVLTRDTDKYKITTALITTTICHVLGTLLSTYTIIFHNLILYYLNSILQIWKPLYQ